MERISYFLSDVFNIMKQDKNLIEGPEYQSLHKYLERINVSSIMKQIRYLSYLTNSQYIKDYSNILEVGSGYGLNLVILKVLGFENVTGIEIEENIFSNSQHMLEIIRKSNPPFNIDNLSIVCGDAQRTDFESFSFKNIISIETVSHVPSRDQFYREMNRLLDVKGTLLIADGNNLSNVRYKRRRLKIWKQIREQELLKRLHFIKKNWPQLDAQYQATLAIHTELLSTEEIKNTIPIILSTGMLPMNLYFEGYSPTFAETGIWDEWGFYPESMKKEINKYGFQVFLKAYYGAARGFPFSHLTSIINSCFPSGFKFCLSKLIIAYCIKNENCRYLVL